jgi:two-component system OmpR family response regulator
MEQMPHILVVDDDREIRYLLARFLEEKHHMRHRGARCPEARRPFAMGTTILWCWIWMLPGGAGWISPAGCAPSRRPHRHADRDGRGD